jgi:aromatic amino acid aminotransferase I / 2-aminoadipate transaminase
MLLNPGDSVIFEEYTYPSALETMHPLRIMPVPIKMDEEGMLDTELRDILDNWNTEKQGRKPRVMYTVP